MYVPTDPMHTGRPEGQRGTILLAGPNTARDAVLTPHGTVYYWSNVFQTWVTTLTPAADATFRPFANAS